MKILVTGAGGVVGRAVVAHCKALGDTVIGYTHSELDIGVRPLVTTEVARVRPDYVINCAAWTDVDGCEKDPARAEQANAAGPENLARACREVGAGLVTISTDYVFDGTREGFYTQRDDPHPLSVYGVTKLAGERRANSALARTVVVRTGWVFGVGGRNFQSRVVELARGGAQLSVINDAYGTPTFAGDLAIRLRELAQLNMPGLFHAENSGPGVSYEEFACVALQLAGLSDKDLKGVGSASLQRPAPRPRQTRLACLWSGHLGLEPLPDWQDSVRRWLA